MLLTTRSSCLIVAKQFTAGPRTSNAGHEFYTCRYRKDDPRHCGFWGELLIASSVIVLILLVVLKEDVVLIGEDSSANEDPASPISSASSQPQPPAPTRNSTRRVGTPRADDLAVQDLIDRFKAIRAGGPSKGKALATEVQALRAQRAFLSLRVYETRINGICCSSLLSK